MIINTEKESDNVIIFLHILKTAGITIHGIIRKQFEDKAEYRIEEAFWMESPASEYLEKYTDEELKKLEILVGHFTFGVHTYLPQKKFTYITLLRNPIEQIISYYYFVRTRYPGVYDNISFEEYLKDDKYNWSTSNIQTRFLSGTPFEPGDFETSKYNLENYFSIVGVTDRFEESISVMKQKFGWDIRFYDNKNVTSKRPKSDEISKELIELIREKNESDFKLFELANKLLDDSLNSDDTIRWCDNI